MAKGIKQLNRIISYRWWRSSGTVKPEHVEALDETAMNRIFEMAKEGFTSGELHDNIHMTSDDPEDGIEYQGWWEITSPRDPW